VWAANAAPPTAAADARSSELLRAEQAVRDKGYAPSRLLTLGRVQLEQGQLGPAIVSFERGRLLAPRDPALREALTAARARAGLSIPAPDTWLERITQHVSLREWSLSAWASCVALSLTLLGLTLVKRRKHLFVAATLASTLALALTGGAVYATRQQLDTAYVLHEASVLRQSPFATAHVLEQLRPGEAVEPQTQHADYVYVVSERGHSGWILKQELAQLAPDARSLTSP
jgi:hypothetical protein